jgi:hypothetical protein
MAWTRNGSGGGSSPAPTQKGFFDICGQFKGPAFPTSCYATSGGGGYGGKSERFCSHTVPIDVTNLSTITINYNHSFDEPKAYFYNVYRSRVGISQSNTSWSNDISETDSKQSRKSSGSNSYSQNFTKVIDVSALTGDYYIIGSEYDYNSYDNSQFEYYYNHGTVTITNVTLE